MDLKPLDISPIAGRITAIHCLLGAVLLIQEIVNDAIPNIELFGIMKSFALDWRRAHHTHPTPSTMTTITTMPTRNSQSGTRLAMRNAVDEEISLDIAAPCARKVYARFSRLTSGVNKTYIAAMNGNELARIGRRLYGEKWVVRMAAELRISRQTIWWWRTGKGTIRPAMAMAIKSLSGDRT